MTKPQDFDLGRLLFAHANELNERFHAGMKAAQQTARHDVRQLIACYDRVMRDPDARIPTSLHHAIEQLRQKYVNEIPDNATRLTR